MNKDKEVEAYKSGNLTPEEQTKYEIAQELGILDKVCLLYTSPSPRD